MEKTDPTADPVPKGLLFKRVPVLPWGKGPSYLGLCLGFSLKLEALHLRDLPVSSPPPKGARLCHNTTLPRRAGPGWTGRPLFIHSLIPQLSPSTSCAHRPKPRAGSGAPQTWRQQVSGPFWPRRVCAWWKAGALGEGLLTLQRASQGTRHQGWDEENVWEAAR